MGMSHCNRTSFCDSSKLSLRDPGSTDQSSKLCSIPQHPPPPPLIPAICSLLSGSGTIGSWAANDIENGTLALSLVLNGNSNLPVLYIRKEI